jgi:dTDP-4-dehydrorhamnose reductase
MLGSILLQGLECYGTTRRHSNNPHILSGIDVTRFDDLIRAFDWAAPEAVVNCTGIVKSECEHNAPDRVIAVNSVAPHVIAAIAAPLGCRVVHVSTDCVFDGTRGSRAETDEPDATDLYGQSKAAGELLDQGHCVTLRTSFIGRDHVRRRGLLEWLLAQKDEVTGYTQAMWSGISANELARLIRRIVAPDVNLKGLYHVSGPIISKADLLQVLFDAYKLPCRVRRVDQPYIDRSLDGSKFKRAIGYAPPGWAEMAKEL